MDDEEDAETDGEQGNGGELGGEDKGDGNAFAWLALVKAYSDMTKEPWSSVWGVNIYEFFNVISFVRTYNEKQKEAIEHWKHKR